MRFFETILRRPVSVVLSIVAILVFGGAAVLEMPLEYMPDMEMPMQLVMITWPGADADSVERLVAQPLEDECQALSNIDSVNSYSYDNYTMLQLTYKYSTDMDDAYTEVKNTVDNMMNQLPDDCGDPVIMELSADYMPTLTVSAVAPDGVNVTSYLNDVVVPAVESVEGVATVSVSGTREEYLRIVLDEAKLRQYYLSINAVGAAIAAVDFDMPVGDVTLGSQKIALGVYGNIEAGPDLRNFPIQTPTGQIITLRDISRDINIHRVEAESISRYDGNDSVMLNMTKQDSASTVAVCNDMMKILDRLEAEDGMGFEVVYSEADSILQTLGEVAKTLAMGVLLTMLVLFIFFGDIRASLVVAISIPLSVLVAIILLNFAGYAIDLMTGTALIIAIGMIVDNSIVILESCFRAREEGLNFHDAAVHGARTMVMSTLAGTLTTIVVYLPLAMAEGMTGMMSAPLSWTVLLTMLSSFLSAIIVVPLAFTKFKPVAKEKLLVNRLLERFKHFYARVMPGLLRHPLRVISVGVVCFAFSLFLLSQMEFVLMPNNYDGSISLKATFRSGTKLEVMDESVQSLEQTLMEDENFGKVTLSISDNTATFTAYASENCLRSSEEAVEEYTQRFGQLPGMDVEVTPTGAMDMTSMMGGSNSKTVTLVGDDLGSLSEGAKLVEQSIGQIPGVLKISNAFDASRVKGRVVINSQKALSMGSSEAAVAMQIYYLLNGMTATTVDYGDAEYDVVLEFPKGKYEDIVNLLDYSMPTQSGRYIVLGDIAQVEYITTLPIITRQDGKYMVTVSATTTEAAKYTAEHAIDAAVAQIAFPEGVSQSASTMDSMTDTETRHIVKALLSAIFLVFLVMAIQFDSGRLSIMVMMCVPLSLIGSIGFVYLTGRPMSLIGLMGFLMLVGIAVNNGIYLVDGTNQLRRTMPLGEALVRAGTTRLRPILMTTLTTIISMVPMIFSHDSGMSMMKDMAYIIIGGLLASTVLAMFLMPAFYLVIRGERVDGTKRKKRFGKQQKEISAQAE